MLSDSFHGLKPKISPQQGCSSTQLHTAFSSSVESYSRFSGRKQLKALKEAKTGPDSKTGIHKTPKMAPGRCRPPQVQLKVSDMLAIARTPTLKDNSE